MPISTKWIWPCGPPRVVWPWRAVLNRISSMVRYSRGAIHELGIEVTAYVLNRVRCNDAQLVHISETIAQKDYRADLRRAIVAERARGSPSFKVPYPWMLNHLPGATTVRP